MNIKWVPVLDALAEQNGCYETRVGSYRLAAWYASGSHTPLNR